VQHLGNFRKGVESQVQAHQPVAQPGRVQAERPQREIERLAGHLPEIGMPALQRAQPGVLQLLVAPQQGEPLGVVGEHLAAARRRRREVEQRAVGVEDAGPDPGEI
jgi:hypothetical protein